MPADTTMHIGRSWGGHPLKDECPCPQAPCGLVARDEIDPSCTEHPDVRTRSMRQGHAADRCPGQAETVANL